MNILPLADLVAVLAGYGAAIWLRFLGDVPARNMEAFQLFLPLLAAVYGCESFFAETRRSRAPLPARHAAAFLACAFAAYAFRERIGALPSSVLALGFVFSLGLSLLVRAILPTRRDTAGSTLVIATAAEASVLRERFGSTGSEHDWVPGDLPVTDLEEKLRSGAYHVALWQDPPADPDLLLNCLFAARSSGTIVLAPAERVAAVDGVWILPLIDRPLVELIPERTSFFADASGRMLDLVLLTVLAPLALPVILLLAAAVRIDSPGPVFYRQRRLGRYAVPFEMLKLRTMPHGVERETGPVWPREDDPRATRVGRILRAVGLDELPQLLHVLDGTMSIVGPRPERHHFVGAHAMLGGRRLLVRPGLTGLAQVSLSKDAPVAEKVRFDQWYFRHRSAGLDVRICLLTIRKIGIRLAGVLRRDAAVASAVRDGGREP